MIEMLQKKLRAYGAANALEEANATKEIIQEIALYALWRADFFDMALFQGGTSLRILHGLPRFSEHLDFLLRSPDPEFRWDSYLTVLVEVFEQFGLQLDAQPKDEMDRAIREAVLKNDSLESQLNLSFADPGRTRAIIITLEIDTNPPLDRRRPPHSWIFPPITRCVTRSSPQIWLLNCTFSCVGHTSRDAIGSTFPGSSRAGSSLISHS